MGRKYDRAAALYESVANVYSTGQIKASKRFQLNFIKPGDKVLFLGVGAGEDAVMAAKAGAQVSCVDISQKMLNQLDRKLRENNVAAELICQSAFEFDRFAHYDSVCANYFLNVFRRPMMVEMLNHSARLVKPGGNYMIADVALPHGNPISKAFNLAYLKSAMAASCAIGLVPWHENYDYESFFEGASLTTKEVAKFRFAKVGPVLFQSIIATRDE